MLKTIGNEENSAVDVYACLAAYARTEGISPQDPLLKSLTAGPYPGVIQALEPVSGQASAIMEAQNGLGESPSVKPQVDMAAENTADLISLYHNSVVLGIQGLEAEKIWQQLSHRQPELLSPASPKTVNTGSTEIATAEDLFGPIAAGFISVIKNNLAEKGLRTEVLELCSPLIASAVQSAMVYVKSQLGKSQIIRSASLKKFLTNDLELNP